MVKTIWTYSDGMESGFGLFKHRIFQQLAYHGWKTAFAHAPLLEPGSKPYLRDHLVNTNPDWILLINQSAGQLYDFLEIPLQQQPADCQKIVWYLDDPHFFIDRPFESNEYVFCFDDTYLDYIQQQNPAACGYLPLASDVAHPGEFDPRFACDICFVGGVVDQTQRRNQLPEDMQLYVDHLVELKISHPYKTFHELALDDPIAPGKQITITGQVAHYLYWEANARYRIRVLESLQDFDLRIYGNEDWTALLKDSPLKDRFMGAIDPVKELPSVFASAKINLNIHSIQCRGSLNQRDFNAPLAGGFLLSDWVPAAGRFFLPGEEAVYWVNETDLRHKVHYFLESRQDRQKIISRGRNRVLREHSYIHRVSEMLHVLEL